MKILRFLLPLVLVVLAGCATHRQDASQGRAYIAKDTSRTVDLTHPPRDMWDRIRRGFAIPNLHSEQVDYWTDYYASHPQSVLLMSQRAGKYLYYIVDELSRRGLPTELALLPFVESAYDPNALSRSQASGLWQFVPSTGLHYNLEQDWWRDQRRDPVASTQAALNYLTYLYDLQGDWYLALASYNWGEGAVKRSMDKAESQGIVPTYLTIDLPDETRNYVPKLQAIKNIIARPDKFGIVLPKVTNAPYFITVHKSRDMDIAVAAALAEMPLDDFRALNPSFNRPIILGKHNPALHLPLDKVQAFNSNLAAYNGNLASWEMVQPKRGESLATIARQHGTTVDQLRAANALSNRTTRVTTALLVPRQAAPTAGVQFVSYQPQPPGKPGLDASPRPTRERSATRAYPRREPVARTHTIRQGDTLYSLARRYNTSVDALRKLNNLKGSSLATGQRLRVPGADVQG
ncbi:transglycosylase SLT domain-containing protein [Castellaniella sp. UC4442_H9]|jgi:membrane-bound lytic murein transglycosylase D|nr:transglycosylase SLT domain-containing protein [Castellaniella sp.]